MKTTSQNHSQIAGCENRLRSRFYSQLSHLNLPSSSSSMVSQTRLSKEARNTTFCPLQEKCHTVVLRGVRNISEAPSPVKVYFAYILPPHASAPPAPPPRAPWTSPPGLRRREIGKIYLYRRKFIGDFTGPQK